MYTPALPNFLPANQPHWIKITARIGLVAKGVVYVLAGSLAFMAAFSFQGKSTQNTEKEGIFKFILEAPFGKVLLGLMGLGLVCYSVWRLLEALLDTNNKGTKPKGLARRFGYAFSGLFYLSFAWLAFQLALGQSSGSGQGDSRQMLARELLEQPFGAWLAGAVAFGFAAMGASQIYRALSGKYLKKIRASGLKSEVKNALIRAGLIGYIARGLVWLLIAFMFLQAARHHNAQEAGGTQQALTLLQNFSYGSILLGAMGLGLICYGIFSFVRARYEVISGQ